VAACTRGYRKTSALIPTSRRRIETWSQNQANDSPSSILDPWETHALEAFAEGADEASSIETLDGTQYMRLMRPLVTQESCLKCHEEQGYAVGDIRGGISVSVPMAPLWAIGGKRARALWLGHGAVWNVGVLGIIGGALLLGAQVRERQRAVDLLGAPTLAIKAAANAVVITDREGVIVWVNPAFTRLTGYEAQEAVGQTPRILKSEKHTPWFYHGMWSTILAGDVWRGEVVNRRKDGSLFTEEMTITPMKDRKGRIHHFVAIKQDITARKQSDYEFRAAAERLASPHRIGQVIRQARTVDDLLDGTLDVLLDWQEFETRGTTAGKGLAYLVDGDGQVLRLARTAGPFNKEFLESEAAIALGQCVSGQAAQSATVLTCENCATDPRHDNHWLGMDVHGHYAVPLKANGHVVGVLSLYATAGVHTDKPRLELLARIGEQVGTAIHRITARA